MKSVFHIILIPILALLASGCPSGGASVRLTINPLSVQLNIGQATTFTVNSSQVGESFTWRSSDTSVATVDTRGRVAAAAPGTTRITATGELSKVQVSANVTVVGSGEIAAVSVSPSGATITAGSTIAIAAKSSREGTTFFWFSGDETVATVSDAGMVTGVGPGTAEITARGATPEERAAATITVVESVVHLVAVHPVEASILMGAEIGLSAMSTDPLDTFEWSSESEFTATVDNDGVVTGVSSGGVIINAVGTNSGARGRAVITVARPIEHQVSVSPSTVTIATGDRTRFAATTTRPGDAFIWSSGDPAIATVDQSGFVTGVGLGTVSISAQGTNPDERGVAMVRVVAGVPRIAVVRPLSASMPAGESITMTASSRDAGESFAWSTSDPAIAVVSDSGVVTGIAPGSAQITAEGMNTGATGASEVTITEALAHVVDVDPSAAAIEVGDTVTLAASSTRVGDRIFWSSSNPAVASVSDSGIVTGTGAGSAVISAEGLDSGASDSAALTVTEVVARALTVRPLSAAIAADATLLLTATSTDPADLFTWTSADTDIAVVNGAGLVTGVAPGTVDITAEGTNSGESDSSAITITEPIVHQVRVSPTAASVAAGETVRFGASSTRAGDSFVWTSEDDAIAAVDATGLVSGIVPGTVTITVTGTVSGVNNTAVVTVLEAVEEAAIVRPLEAGIRIGETVALSAESSNAADEFEWAAGDGAVASVDGDGLVTGLAAGVTGITATGTVSGASGDSVITVEAPVVHQVGVAPLSATIFPEEVLQLVATTTRVGDTFTWSSSDPAVAAVDAAGRVTGIGTGTAAITAQGSVPNERGTATVIVIPRRLDTVSVQPLGTSIAAGETVLLAAASSNIADLFTWSSSNSTVAAVNATGLVMGVTVGTADIMAAGTVSGAIGGAVVTVTQPPVHLVTVSPAIATIEVASTVALAATTTDDADTFSWSSVDATVATVSSNGLVTGVAPGTAQINVAGTNSGVTASSTITVVAAALHSVLVEPAENVVFVGGAALLTATSTNASDNFTWSTANAAIATVSAAGVVTGTGPGTVEIAATGTASGARSSAMVTVNSHVLTVAPPTLALLAGTSAPLSATSTDTGEPIQWTSGDVSVATVTGAGVVTGVGGGMVTIRATGTRSGIQATAAVSVRDGVVVNPPSATVVQGDALQLGARSTNDTDSFAWSSGNPSLATVDGTGLVTAVGAGSVLIEATGNESGESATASITVVPRVSVTPRNATVPVGRIVEIVARPLEILDAMTWTSSNPGIATVNHRGVVTGVSVGTVRISVEASASKGRGFADVEVLPDFPNLRLFDGEQEFSVIQRAFRDTAQAFRGVGCLRGEPDQSTGFGVRIVRQNISQFDEIWMMIKAQGTGAHGTLFFAGQGSSKTVNITDYAAGGTIGSTYQLLRIPIADLVSETFDFSSVDIIRFGPRAAGLDFRIFVDEIWAVNLESVDAAGGPLPGALPATRFGIVSVTEPATRVLPVRNIGASRLTVHNVAITGPGAGSYLVTPTIFNVEPGASTPLTITFAPVGAGNQQATLTLNHNATALGDSTVVALDGEGMAARLQLSADSIEFGAAPLGSSVIQRVSFSNTGNEQLVITGVSVTGDAFSVGGGMSVAPGATGSIAITAAPLALGNADGTLNFATNDPSQTAMALPLRLEGVAANLAGRLPLRAFNVTSSTATVNWGQWPLADQIRVYVGPEPPTTPGAPLPVQYEVASLPGEATSYAIENLAAGVDVFIRVEASALGIPIGSQNIAVQTPGGPGVELDTKLREVHLLAPNILQVVMTDLRVHSFREDANNFDMGIEEIIGDTGAAWQAGPWTVRRADGTEIPVENIHRHTSPVGAPYYNIGYATSTNDHLLDLDHRIYLELAENVGSPEVLQITGPTFDYEIIQPDLQREFRSASLDVILPFSDRYLATPAIQVNQLGYSPAATRRYAYVSGWIGDGGPLDLSGYPANAQVLVESSDPLQPRAVALSGLPITLRAAMDQDSGTEVRDIDIAALPESDTATYRVRVPGVGVSWPTQVNELAVFEAFYHIARGMFHNRWAGDLAPEYTDWTRPVDHGYVFTSEGLNPWAFFTGATPRVGERPLFGGHHDAGDFDIRPFHQIVAQLLMRAFEINESAFTDGQLTIPESGNGVPDLLDEALWSVAAWEYLQEDDGGVRIGAESNSHPPSFYLAHEDPLPYWTYSRLPVFTARCAGLFAQAARLVAPYDGIRAHMLEQRAIAAFDYAVANGVGPNSGGALGYAASELFRLTGDDVYRKAFVDAWNAKATPSPPFAPLFFDREILGPGVFTSPEQNFEWDHVTAYIESGAAASEHVSAVRGRVGLRPAELLARFESAHAHRNGRISGAPLTFGKSTSIGQYLFGAYAALQMGNLNDQSVQDVYDMMSLSADYVLGCNPSGMSWITGLGSRRPMDPLHLDSLAFIHAGQGPIPGIPLYGPVDNLPMNQFYTYAARLTYPAFADSPKGRRYADVHYFVICNEFSVWETQAPMTQLFASLIAPDMVPPEDWLPRGAK